MAYSNVDTGLLRAQNDRLGDQMAANGKLLAAQETRLAELQGEFRDIERKKAVMTGLAELLEAQSGARKAGTADDAEMWRSMVAALRGAREMIGGDGGLDELISQAEMLARGKGKGA